MDTFDSVRNHVRSHLAESAPAEGMGRCDFCNRLLPNEGLQVWPCKDFVVQLVIAGHTLYQGCECHTAAALPPGELLDSHGYEGAWAACRDCRRDVDAERWRAITRRALRTRPPEEDVPLIRDQYTGLQAMFRAHRETVARWRPFTKAGAER